METYVEMLKRGDLLKKITRFLLSGSTAAAVLFLSSYVLHEILEIRYLLSSIISFILTIIVSFFLQKFWTFQNSSLTKMGMQFKAYIFLSIFNLAINTVGMYVLVDIFLVHYLLSQMFMALIIAAISFFVYLKIIFVK